jgi:lysine decarboxylase
LPVEPGRSHADSRQGEPRVDERADEPQTFTPYLDALAAFASRGAERFHVPGHKGGLAAGHSLREHLGSALPLDVPACTQGIDVGPQPTPLNEAEALAAAAWGAAQTFFLVNGASEGSHIACLALAHRGNRVVVQRNVHSSTIHGMVLAGLEPVFVETEFDPELGVAHAMTAEALAAALADTPDAAGALVVSPTYFGATADVRSLATITHRHGVPLVVDEAWGAHFAFHPKLPADALSSGADIVIHGTHKTIGSLTQSAMLHVGRHASRFMNVEGLERSLGLVRSTSPSSLLIASLDAARSHAATDGRRLLGEALRDVDHVRRAIRAIVGLGVLDEQIINRPGVFDFDPLRIVVRTGSMCARELARHLHEIADVHLELVTDRLIVVHFGLGEPIHERGLRLVEVLAEAVRVGGLDTENGPALDLPVPEPGPLAMSPRAAFFAQHDLVPLEQSVGRISAETVVAYPPGIASVVPGELLSADIVDGVRSLMERGATLRGTFDGSLETIRVVKG